MSKLFIDRPIFAWVIAIIIMLMGIGAILQLPVAQYPDVAPTQISVRASYPGASAETLENSVTQVLERQLTGIDGLLYFQSSSTARGQVSINATFDKAVDPDIAQVQVQNRVAQALPRLPAEGQRIGVVTEKSTPDFIMVVHLVSPDGRYVVFASNAYSDAAPGSTPSSSAISSPSCRVSGSGTNTGWSKSPTFFRPSPPWRAMAMAMRDSVTVSMAEETRGMASRMPRVSRLLVSTSAGTTSDAGTRRSSMPPNSAVQTSAEIIRGCSTCAPVAATTGSSRRAAITSTSGRSAMACRRSMSPRSSSMRTRSTSCARTRK